MSSLLRNVTQDSIDLLRKTIDGNSELTKAFTQPGSATTGIQNYSLEVPAKSLIPVLTPLRNRIPRRMATGGIQANWKAFTGVNTTNLDIGLSDGNRGGVMVETSADYSASYKQLGLESSVTRGARLAAEQFMDLLATGQTHLLWAVMLAEEALDLWGNASQALGTPAQAGASDVGTGGSLVFNTSYGIRVVALTLAGYAASTVAGGVRTSVTRTNADGTTDTYGGGSSIASPVRNITTANDAASTHSILATVAPVVGAVAYAWFWGTGGVHTLGAITTINSVVITAAATGSQVASGITSDNSTNALVYDGILTQVAKQNYGGYFATMATGTAGVGTPLTGDTRGGIVEIDLALKYFWDVSRLSPDTIWVSSQEAQNILNKVLNAGASGAQRFMVTSDRGNLIAGDAVTTYLNKFTLNGAKPLTVRLHPNLPAGTLFFDSESLPYPMSDVDAVLVKRLRQDYLAEVWPQTKRKVEYSVSFDGVLQNYAPFAFGVITNIANG